MKPLTQYNRPSAMVLLFVLLGLVTVESVFGMQRPCIWADAKEKARLQELIDNYDWAADCFNDIKQFMAPRIENHKKSPSKSLESVPAIPDDINNHIAIQSQALEAAILYFMTGNEDYAQYSADIFNVYVQELAEQETQSLMTSTSGPGRDLWDVYPQMGLSYDFIHAFLMKTQTTVFDKASQKRIPFDKARTQLVFRKIVEKGFDYWVEGSNHAEREAPGILYCALGIEDEKQREAYLQTFLKGSKPMTGLYWMKQLLVENDGVWPESSSYNLANNGVLILMEVIDRIYPELNIFKDFEKGMDGGIERLSYIYPNNSEMMCFGDAHRKTDPIRLPHLLTRVVRRAGYEDVAKRIFGQMKFEREQFGYAPRVRTRPYSWLTYQDYYIEFFCMDELQGYKAKSIASDALVHPYAGLVMQKNLNCADETEHGMMYYTGGAEYVHSHLSGLDFEIFGAGYVMSGVGGLYTPRNVAIFNDYYRSYAGHNTVVVNGKSRGGAEGFWGQQKILYMNTTRMEAMEPKPYTQAISKDFAFSSQILNDEVNNATQQRIVSIVRTSSTTGYYFDLFRSRSGEENKHHDYIYHNIGETFVMREAGDAGLSLAAVPDRYLSYPVTMYRVNPDEETTIYKYISPNDNRGKYTDSLTLRFPGWHYFSNVMSSAPNVQSIHGTFYMDALKRYNHVAMPGGFAREYTACEAPPIYDAVKPYAAIAIEGAEEKSKAQVLSIRQPGEAWDRPFIVIYEPSANEKPTVQSVENIIFDGKVIGATVVSHVDGKVITDRIIARDGAGIYEDPDTRLSFTGRFGIIRTVKSSSSGPKLELYIGDGKELTFQGHRLVAENGKAFLQKSPHH